MKIRNALFYTLASILLISCSTKVDEEFKPEFVTNYKLNLPEPSGLALALDGNSLWVVSDNNNTVYKISFEGEIINSFKVSGPDLEGITQIDEATLAVVLERDRTVVIIDTNGKELKRIKINSAGALNFGFEGITYNPDNRHLYIINQKEPGKLIELDEEYNVVKETELTFAKDYSGINYNNENNGFWILSSESSLIAQCDINGRRINSYTHKIEKVEGVAVDKNNRIIYLVSDLNQELYVFKY